MSMQDLPPAVIVDRIQESLTTDIKQDQIQLGLADWECKILLQNISNWNGENLDSLFASSERYDLADRRRATLYEELNTKITSIKKSLAQIRAILPTLEELLKRKL